MHGRRHGRNCPSPTIAASQWRRSEENKEGDHAREIAHRSLSLLAFALPLPVSFLFPHASTHACFHHRPTDRPLLSWVSSAKEWLLGCVNLPEGVRTRDSRNLGTTPSPSPVECRARCQPRPSSGQSGSYRPLLPPSRSRSILLSRRRRESDSADLAQKEGNFGFRNIGKVRWKFQTRRN